MIRRRHRRDVWEKEPGGRSEVEAVNAERIELLTRKLSNDTFTAEDQSQLDSLTARLQQLAPRVTEKDWEQLGDLERMLDERETIIQQVTLDEISSGGYFSPRSMP
jgi:hypothetical protein